MGEAIRYLERAATLDPATPKPSFPWRRNTGAPGRPLSRRSSGAVTGAQEAAEHLDLKC